MGEYLDSRANRSSGSEIRRDGQLAFRTVRTSDETVVLLAGNESFASGASASGTNKSVSVVAGDDRR
jgi:hypothetical protein